MTTTVTDVGGRALVAPVTFPDETVGQWFVLHTRHRQEKVLADMLGAKGVHHWLPMVREPRRYGRHKVTLELPLFPGYLFLRGSVEEAYGADRTNRVVSIIPVKDQRRMDWELRNLYMAIVKGALPEPYRFLARGVRVRVRSGPFEGLEGVVEERSANGRLVLQVETLGQAVSLEIDVRLLELM
jgi:transcription antitermination factor NusG